MGLSAGFLPDPGGMLDQSCWTMAAFRVIAKAESELQPAGGS